MTVNITGADSTQKQKNVIVSHSTRRNSMKFMEKSRLDLLSTTLTERWASQRPVRHIVSNVRHQASYSAFSWTLAKKQYSGWLAIVAVFQLNSIGCANSNQPIATALKALPQMVATTSVSRSLEISETNYVCIFEPYSNKIHGQSLFSNQINKHLNQEAYLADEGHWIFLHGISEQWIAEKIKRTSLELEELRDKNGKKIDSICGYANTILLNKPSLDKVTFNLMEKK